jgi:hypothetical protein
MTPASQHKVRQRQMRHMVEVLLGRRLKQWEQVHHINEDPADNLLSNLTVITPRVHKWLHSKGPSLRATARRGLVTLSDVVMHRIAIELSL